MNFIHLFFKIYSYFPFFSLTDDNNFGTNEGKKHYGENGSPSYRFSIINFCYGSKSLYFLTINLTTKEIKLIHILELEKCGMLKYNCNSENILNKTNKYNSEHLVTLSTDDIEIEKEFINYLMDNENKRIETSINKINLYATIILAVIPILLAFFDIEKFLEFKWYEKILAGLIFYCIFNIAKYVFDSVKVRAIDKSSFMDLKKSEQKNHQISMNYYFDWQMLREKAVIWVSLVKNIEDWIKYALILVVILTSVNSINLIIQSNRSIITKSENVVITINLDNLKNPFSEDSKQLSEIHLNLKNKEVRTLYIIGGLPLDDKTINEVVQQYKIYEPAVSVEYYIDNTLPFKTIRFLEGGK